MIKETHQQYTPIINSAFIVLSLIFILLIHGAIPFLSMPTLGQAIWTMGFSQSFANQSIVDLYATNFGNPVPAAISFGLAGAYPSSLFIRAGLHPADAYTLMTALWLSVAFYGAWKISRAFKLSIILSALASTLWLSMPIVWWHAGYSMLMLGIGLLPFYFYTSLRLFQCFGDSQKTPIRVMGLYLSVVLIAVFMDGYSFIMFAVGSSILGGYTFLRFPEYRTTLLKYSFPIHLFSFTLAYVLYVTYIGKTQFDASSLDFFRGWGVDLMFLTIPSQGVHWLWDSLGLSVPRTGHEQFGDASVWATTFAVPVIAVGITAWWRIRKDFKISTGFLLVALFGFYMGMGPSIKFNSVKPEGVNVPLMAHNYAVAPTGNAWLSKYMPGFKNMRAAYRWTALGFLGFWLLIVVLLSQEQTTRFKWLAVFLCILLIVSDLPNMSNKLAKNIDFRNDFYDIEKSLVGDLKKIMRKGEMVAFLPYRNDFFVNYLASRIDIHSYNIGGDKNLITARNHWPTTMAQFSMGTVDEDFVNRVLLLLSREEASAVVLPYIDLLWAAHTWPTSLTFKNKMMPIIAELREADFIDVDEREFYTVVRLKKKYRDPIQLEQIRRKINQVYCVPLVCLQYKGSNHIPSQVGIHTGKGMKTDGRQGYLMFGPYRSMKKGQYILQVTGKVNSNGDNVIVDVVHHKAGKFYARFKGLNTQNELTSSVLLDEKVTLDEDAEALEVRVYVDKVADLFIDGYSLRPINSENNKEDK